MQKLIENLIFGLVVAAVLAAVPAITFAQNTWIAPPPRPEPTMAPADPKSKILPVAQPNSMSFPLYGGDTYERSIKVDSSVNIELCVTQGTVKVNGWNRKEVRVFVENGSKFGIKVREKSAKTNEPALISVAGVETKNKFATTSSCIWGEEIEIDVPLNATINLRGQETTTTIDSVKKVDVNTIGGDISLRNITGGINAIVNEGDVTVEASGGAMSLESTTGNILVFEARPSEIGDIFKARTNSGEISLQRLQYRRIEVKSVSGSVAFIGEILSGGSYGLSTSKGSIRMSIPHDSSGQIFAAYGYGSFNTEIPIKISTENIHEGPIKSIVGTFGKGGDAILKLAANNGSISIKKL